MKNEENNLNQNTIESPCIKMCELDFKTRLCKGCYRTIDEIANWSIMNDKEKLKVLELIKTRKEYLSGY